MELIDGFVTCQWCFLLVDFYHLHKIVSVSYTDTTKKKKRGFLTTSYSSVKVIVNMSMPN